MRDRISHPLQAHTKHSKMHDTDPLSSSDRIYKWHRIYHIIISPANEYINSSHITSFSDIIPGTVWGPVPSEITSTSSGISSWRDSWELASASPSWAMLVRLRLRADAGMWDEGNVYSTKVIFKIWNHTKYVAMFSLQTFWIYRVYSQIHVSPNIIKMSNSSLKRETRELRLICYVTPMCSQ